MVVNCSPVGQFPIIPADIFATPTYMKNAQLLILDEPTAALDARAAYQVFQRFSELTKGKTAY